MDSLFPRNLIKASHRILNNSSTYLPPSQTSNQADILSIRPIFCTFCSHSCFEGRCSDFHFNANNILAATIKWPSKCVRFLFLTTYPNSNHANIHTSLLSICLICCIICKVSVLSKSSIHGLPIYPIYALGSQITHIPVSHITWGSWLPDKHACTKCTFANTCASLSHFIYTLRYNM